MKAENWNKRTKRKEIQFSDEEYIAVEQKASAARIPVAAYIRQAALDKTLSAALSIEELEIMKRISAISYKMQVNLNQLAKLANKVRDLQERNDNLMKVSSTYYFYTADGERMFCERYKCRMYPDKMGMYWYFKVGDNPSYCLPQEISQAYHRREISIQDVYFHWKETTK